MGCEHKYSTGTLRHIGSSYKDEGLDESERKFETQIH